jgi:hypothetical protein
VNWAGKRRAFGRFHLIAILATVAVGSGGAACLLGGEKGEVPSPFQIVKAGGGRWASPNEELDPARMTETQKEMVQQLQALGYMTGVNKAEKPGGGVVRDATKAFPGYGLYVSGHGLEAILIDTNGTALHRWTLPAEGIWKRTENLPSYFRRAHLWENGDLMVIVEGVGIVKMDKRSRILWKEENGAHHDFQVTANGDIYLLTREPHVVPTLDASRPFFEDYFTVLGPDGHEILKKSALEMLLASPQKGSVGRPDSRLPPYLKRDVDRGDLLHLNTLELVPADSAAVPWLKKGTIITSSPYLCSLMAFDLEHDALTWFYKKDFTGQHEPRLLANGDILFFDNHNDTKRSKVVELDPKTGATVWEYDGAPDNRFYSQCCSTARRLPNGDTQIVITDMGKVIEVTPDKRIVWEFDNPHRTGERNELVASIFDMVRLPADFPIGWADESTL